jgi:hypothetical protein
MPKRFAGAAAAAVLLSPLGGCAQSQRPSTHAPDTLPAGTAQLVVDSGAPSGTHAVVCTRLGSMTTITTGDNNAGTNAIIDNAEGLRASAVTISNADGFTGSYLAGLQGRAHIQMTRQTYDITGTAVGLVSDLSAAATKSFTLRVAC